MHRLLTVCAPFGLACLLAGCNLGPDYHRPGVADMPADWRATPATAAETWPAADWWRGFGSPELNALIDAARQQNFDIQAAIARVVQADAQVRIAGAALLPSLNATGNATWQQVGVTTHGFTSGSTFNSATTSTADTHNYGIGLNIAYQTDFWGMNRATQQAAMAGAVFSRFDQQVVALTVVTSVATTWFTALDLQDRIVIAERNLDAAEQVLRVIQGRMSVGTASALDEAQQAAFVEGQRALIPNLRNQMEQQLIGLGILVGQSPQAITVRPGTLDGLSLPLVQPGLPSTLLQRRPDVAEAEAELVAQNFDIQAARAAFFPNIQLTGSHGFSNAALQTLFSPGGAIASAVASLSQPIFDAGTLRGQLELTKGRYAELLADYRKAVVQSLTDVESALTAWRFATEQEALQQRAVDTAQRAADVVRAQMDAGTVDVTTVLNVETTLFTDRDVLAQVRLARFQALLSLYKALGGGWQQPPGEIVDQFPGLSPGILPGGIALPVGGNVQ